MIITGIWTNALISEKSRPKIPPDMDLSSMTQEQKNGLYQNRISVEEFEAYKKPIHIAVEHGPERDIGYVMSMWVNSDMKPVVKAFITDQGTVRKIKNGHFKGLSLKAHRKISDDGSVGPPDIEEISLTANPFFEDCKLSQCASKNKLLRKTIYDKKNHKKSKVLTLIASIKMSENEQQQSSSESTTSTEKQQQSSSSSSSEVSLEELKSRLEQAERINQKYIQRENEEKKIFLEQGNKRAELFISQLPENIKVTGDMKKVIMNAYNTKEMEEPRKFFESLEKYISEGKRKRDQDIHNSEAAKKQKLFHKPSGFNSQGNKVISQEASGKKPKKQKPILVMLLNKDPNEWLIDKYA